jgi:hypothetical protein
MAFPGVVTKPNDSKIKKASSKIIAPLFMRPLSSKALAVRESGNVLVCEAECVGALEGVRFVYESHEQYVVLCSTFDKCVHPRLGVCAKYVVIRVRLLALRGDHCGSEDVSLHPSKLDIALQQLRGRTYQRAR